MYKPVPPQVRFTELDERWLAHWREQRIFERSVEERIDGPSFTFYEGPPTANGKPHAGHVLTRVMKDVFLRYRSMCGFHVPRNGGWDTHGLPVEVEVEKELGIHGREAIESYGVEAFTRKCVDSVFRYIDSWREMSERIAFWVDLDASYVTFHRSYVESVWWALKSLYDQDLLYQDHKIVWWWPQGGTALSAGEVGQGYKEVDDPSVTVRFRLKGDPGTSFLAWTTTPWTLPSNVGLAVHPEVSYVTVSIEGADGPERLVFAKPLTAALLGEQEHDIIEERLGQGLIGTEYVPPFSYGVPEGGPAHRIISADFVTTDSGTGMVHIAPAFGEDDFRICKEAGLGFLQLIAPDGTFVPEVTDFAGRFCKEADQDIIRHLRKTGLLFQEKRIRHEYPFCWRAMSDPLIQYARRSWFVRTTDRVDQLLANNDKVHWEPQHIKEGRFGSFLRSNVDWALSRERYWGTPLPIWVNDETGKTDAVGSVADILERNPNAFEAFEAARKQDPSLSEHLIVHKPFIDQVTWTKPGEAGVYRRVPEVIDVWFDSGCMPFAQWGYPHQNKDEFRANFPADFITEAVDQTRGWFYSLTAISTLLFAEEDKPHPFRNCTVLGFVTDEDGKKLSKRDKNYKDPMELIGSHGADALRWALYTNCLPGQNTRFGENYVLESLREFLLKLWNVYSFFVTYARIDGFDHQKKPPLVAQREPLDRWILAELNDTVEQVRESLDGYRSHHAVRALTHLNECLSNWYLRRSRNRFWSDQESTSKAAGFATLHEVLVDFAKLLAPFCPFLAEEMFQNLTAASAAGTASVHLEDFPTHRDDRADPALRAAVTVVRDVVSLGQRVRTDAKQKVRQPLGAAIAVVTSEEDRAALESFSSDVCEELNVHRLELSSDPKEFVTFTFLPNFRRLGKRLGSRIPALKKQLGAADGAALHSELETQGELRLQLDGEELVLGPEDVEIRLQAKEDFGAAASGARVVVLDTRVTDELRAEGFAREVVNRIQRARKGLDLAFETRIAVRWNATPELSSAIEQHAETIQRETLSLDFAQDTEHTEHPHRVDVEGHELTFSIQPLIS